MLDSDDEFCDSSDAVAPVALAPPASTLSICPEPQPPSEQSLQHRVLCGRGRHGSLVERRLVATRMREAKQRKKAAVDSLKVGRAVSSFLQKRCMMKPKARRQARAHFANAFQGDRNVNVKKVLKLCSGRAEGKLSSKLASHEDLLDMALGKELGVNKCTAVALSEGITRQWVRVCRNVVAAAYLHWQAKTLGYLIRICQAHRPLFAFARYAWDETGEPLTVPVCKEMRLEHQIGVWQVMVSRLRIVLVWGAEHGGRC